MPLVQLVGLLNVTVLFSTTVPLVPLNVPKEDIVVKVLSIPFISCPTATVPSVTALILTVAVPVPVVIVKAAALLKEYNPVQVVGLVHVLLVSRVTVPLVPLKVPKAIIFAAPERPVTSIPTTILPAVTALIVKVVEPLPDVAVKVAVCLIGYVVVPSK